MASSVVIAFALFRLLQVEGAQYALPATALAQPTAPAAGAYYSNKNVQSTSTGHGASPRFSHYSTAGGSYRNYNVPGVSGSTAMYFKDQRTDKSMYNNVASNAVGRNFGNGAYNARFTNMVQEPVRGRHGGYNLPVSGSPHVGAYGSYGGYRSVGFYGVKAPSGYSYPKYVNTAQPQGVRGGRVNDGKPLQQTNYKPTTKNTGVYVIPTPSKLYFDGKKN